MLARSRFHDSLGNCGLSPVVLRMAAEALLEGWKNLRLTADEEKVTVDVDSKAVLDTSSRMSNCLAGKLLAPRYISCKIIRKTMLVAWRVEIGMSMEKIGKNIFLFSFDRVHDRNRVFRSGSWYFDKFLLVLIMLDSMIKPSALQFDKVAFWTHFFDLPMACMNQSMAKRLGNAVGEFETVDGNDQGCCWGSSMRV